MYDQFSIHCNKCSTTSDSCAYLQCFLKGNHQGHESIINAVGSGNLDCGDLSQWKRQGCCSLHHSIDEDSRPENYIYGKLRNILTDVIFKACFSAIKHLHPEDTKNLEIIFISFC